MGNWPIRSKSVFERRGNRRRFSSREIWAGVWSVLLLFSGCGYRPATISLPADRTLAFSTFDAQIADATVATAVTRAIREALLSRGWRIVSPEENPKAELTGQIVKYKRTPTALDLKGRAQGYRLSMTLAYRLGNSDHRLPERQVIGTSEYAASPDAARGQTAERQAVREAARQAGEALADALPALWPALLQTTPTPDSAPSLSPSP